MEEIEENAETVTIWANPMLKLTSLAEMSGKSYTWLREQMRSDDPPPNTRPGKNAQPLVLWSDYVEWFKRKWGRNEEIKNKNQGGTQ